MAVWFGFWAWFGIASGIGEGGSNLIFHLIFPVLVFALPVAVVWKWEFAGALLLTALGLVIAVGYPFMFHNLLPWVIVTTDLMLALPPLAAGILLLLSRIEPPQPDKTGGPA
ncbi:MAG: hypothetical protein C4524_15440 [Candidatus Zixiibacteriota bacterium]|nr:MAG: hypothetical protein C4524_15440 [candidate division Zixibacteria bacterium]